MKQTQLQIIKAKLDQYGRVSRNECIPLYIYRLGAIIDKLKKPPYNYKLTAGYEHGEYGKDYVYRAIDSDIRRVLTTLPPAFDPKPEKIKTNQGELL